MAKLVTCSVCGASVMLGKNAISVSDENDDCACDWHYGIQRDENGNIISETALAYMQSKYPGRTVRLVEDFIFTVEDN